MTVVIERDPFMLDVGTAYYVVPWQKRLVFVGKEVVTYGPVGTGLWLFIDEVDDSLVGLDLVHDHLALTRTVDGDDDYDVERMLKGILFDSD